MGEKNCRRSEVLVADALVSNINNTRRVVVLFTRHIQIMLVLLAANGALSLWRCFRSIVFLIVPTAFSLFAFVVTRTGCVVSEFRIKFVMERAYEYS